MFTPQAVHQSATRDANEVLVSGVDERGNPQNVLLRQHPDLRARLEATPTHLVNPEHKGKADAHAYAVAQANVLRAELADTPETIGEANEPNPAHAERLSAIATADQGAEAARIELEATPAVLPNPDRAPIEQEAFDAALEALKPKPAAE